MHKYYPLVLTSVFTIGALTIALLLSFVSYLIDGGEFIAVFQRMQGFLFIAVVAISLGILASEIKCFIKSHIRASLLFGILSPLLFIGCLLIDSILFNGSIKAMPDEFYLIMYMLFGFLSGAIYFGTLKNT